MKRIVSNRVLRIIFQAGVLILAAVVLLPQLRKFFEDSNELNKLNPAWLICAVLSFFLTYITGVMVYYAIADRKLNFKRTLIVQTATGFTNRLLPSGIGGLGTFAQYLKKAKFSPAESIILVIANNALGFVAFALVLFASGVLTPAFMRELMQGVKPIYAWIFAGALTLGLLIFVSFSSVRKKVGIQISRGALALLKLAVSPSKLIGGLGSSLLITITSILTLHFCLLAAGISLPVADLVFVFAICTLAIGVSPTPGGLGAAELGLVIALDRVGQSSALALSAVVAYRLISFWLPTIPGYIAFRYLTSRRLI